MTRRRILALLLTSLASRIGAQPLQHAGANQHDIDVSRFMGDWYVIAYMPTLVEHDIYDAVEHDTLDSRGRVDTTLRYRPGSLGNPIKTVTSNAIVEPGTGNSHWQVQFFWPLRFEYDVAYVDPNYQTAILARTTRASAWILARQPHLDEATYAMLVDKLRSLGRDVSKLQRVPFPS